MQRLPAPVTAYLDAVTDRVADALGPRLIGVYTTGSVALGDYRPGRSDIDLAAVVTDTVDSPSRRRLAEWLDHDVLPCPAAGLEFVLYPEATVRAVTVGAGYLLNLNTGPELPSLVSLEPADGPAFWYLIDRDVTRQSGRALHGPPADQVFAPVPYELLITAVGDSMRAHRDRHGEHKLDNAVLNGCRSLVFAETGHWYAKLDAAEQILASVDSFTPLVRAAAASFRAGRSTSAHLPSAEVDRFLDRVLAQLNPKTREPDVRAKTRR